MLSRFQKEDFGIFRSCWHEESTTSILRVTNDFTPLFSETLEIQIHWMFFSSLSGRVLNGRRIDSREQCKCHRLTGSCVFHVFHVTETRPAIDETTENETQTQAETQAEKQA